MSEEINEKTQDEKVLEHLLSFSKSLSEASKGEVQKQKNNLESALREIKLSEENVVKYRAAFRKAEKKMIKAQEQVKKVKDIDFNAKFQQELEQTKLHPLVESIYMGDGGYHDETLRIIVDTKMLHVKYGRSKPREIGKFSMMILWRGGGWAIKLLNLTARYHAEFDSPVIRKTEPCWGNIQKDIVNDCKQKNLYETVCDLIDYIQSPSVTSGYLRDDDSGKSYGGWLQWFSGIQPTPAGLNHKIASSTESEEQQKNMIEEEIKYQRYPREGSPLTVEKAEYFFSELRKIYKNLFDEIDLPESLLEVLLPDSLFQPVKKFKIEKGGSNTIKIRMSFCTGESKDHSATGIVVNKSGKELTKALKEKFPNFGKDPITLDFDECNPDEYVLAIKCYKFLQEQGEK